MEKVFNYCPACGSRHITQKDSKMLTCPDCCFVYFHNVATATGVIITFKGRIILLRRSQHPAKGQLALPGGFANPMESADQAVLRECHEELGMRPKRLRYLGSFPNVYVYKNVTYHSCDMFFSGIVDNMVYSLQPEEVSELILVQPDKIPWDDIAFPSVSRALRLFIKRATPKIMFPQADQQEPPVQG